MGKVLRISLLVLAFAYTSSAGQRCFHNQVSKTGGEEEIGGGGGGGGGGGVE
jgi:hypothetical protein